MKKFFVALFATLISFSAHALPHDNRSDVDTTVKVFVPYSDFALSADSVGLFSLGTNNPRVAQVNSLGLAGLQVTATGDNVRLLFPVPKNACIECPMKFSIVWSSASTTTTQTATYSILYARAPLGTALSVPASTLSTAIAADAVNGNAYSLNETPQGILNGKLLQRNDILSLLVSLSAVSGLNPVASPTFIHGINIEYVREKL